MGYYIMVIDSKLRFKNCREFMNWYETAMKYEDDIDYNDYRHATDNIQQWFMEMKEIIEVPFGSIIYFLALEDEKPVLYVELASRMGSNDLYIINEDSYDCYDIYDGYPPEIKEKYFNHLKSIGKINNRFEFSKKIKNLKRV